MLQLPQSPLSFTTRRIRCVSCQEQFTVAEAFVGENHHRPKQRGRVGDRIENDWTGTHLQSWREPVINGPDHGGFPRPVVYGHLTPTVAAALPLFDRTVECPRCGSDNRNWLQLQTRPNNRGSLMGISLDRFPLAFAGVIIVMALAAASLWVSYESEFRPLRAVIMAVTIGLTGYLATRCVTGSWFKQREFQYRRPFLPKGDLWQQSSPALRAGLPVLPVTLIVVPLILFILFPLSLNVMAWLLAPAGTASELGIDINRDFFRTWFWFVGGAWTTATLMAVLSVSGFVGKIDNMLPLPLFTSVARMTPVAIREAEIALRPDIPTLPEIQWTHVERLPHGGIKLAGLHREALLATDELPDTVRAQQYTIQTDHWCRLIESDLRDVNVPPAIQRQPAATAVPQRRSRLDTPALDRLFRGERADRS
jgi:DNA-directed RNA polymerase subunit M/transcription elongation factor TFIIS